MALIRTKFEGYRRDGTRVFPMDGGSAPTPPDPYQTAGAQTQSNLQTANYNAGLNRVNTSTPWGSLTYSHSPAVGGTPGTAAVAPTFNQSAYDQAMQQYQSAASQNSGYGAEGSGGGGTSMTAPNRADFMTGGSPATAGTAGTQPDQWSANVTLSPEQQHLLDLQNQTSAAMGQTALNQIGQVSNTLGHPVNFNGAPSQVTNVQSGPMVSGVNYGQIQDRLNTSNVPGLVGGDQLAGDLNTQRNSLYNQQTAFLDPQWKNNQNDLENQLTQQGIMRGSDAWNRATSEQGRQKEFAYGQARDAAITGGGAEQSRLFGLGLAANQNAFGQDLASGQFANSAQAQGFGQAMGNAQLSNSVQQQQFAQAMANAGLQNQGRQQNINEILQQRDQPLNELSALRNGSQVTAPNFPNVPGTNMQGTDIAGLISQNYANQMGGYNSNVAQNNGIMNGLFSLGSAAMMSDRRLKEDIKRVGSTDDGLPIYTFKYKGFPRTEMGVMAQDVLKVKPEAVHVHESGYLMVDYGRI